MSRLVTGLLVAVLALLGACGIPTDSEPRVLADESTTTAPGAGDRDPGDSTADVYLVDPDQRLEARTRPLDGAKTAGSVLDALLLPLSEEETDAGLTTVIPEDTTASVTQEDGTVLVDMSEAWQDLSQPGATTAYAQVVLTLTELLGVERVRFSIEGRAQPAPTVNQGELDEVTADDYANLDPG